MWFPKKQGSFGGGRGGGTHKNDYSYSLLGSELGVPGSPLFLPTVYRLYVSIQMVFVYWDPEVSLASQLTNLHGPSIQ